METIEANFVRAFKPSCILVKRGDKYHVRDYKRPLKSGKGIELYKAVFKSGYMNLRTESKNFVKDS